MRAGHPVVVAALVGLAIVGPGPLLAPAPCQDSAQGELEIYDAIPAEPAIRVRVGERRQFSLWVRGEGLRYQWMLDGGVVGDRRAWAYVPQPADTGLHLVSVAVEAPSGRVVRTWRVQVEAVDATAPVPMPPLAAATTSSTATTHEPTTSSIQASTTSTTTARPTTTVHATTSTTVRPTTSTMVRPTTSTTLRPTTTTTFVPPTTTTVPRGAAVTEDDVRALFERYEDAWRNRDIRGLQAVGQVTTQGQVDALESYFDSVEELEVEVAILAIVTSGDEARVRFIRRDHFRDPGGTRVTKESPVIEKRILRTPGGLKLAPLR